MNIYCVIFMCTFGANNTDTEAPSTNSLLNNSLHNVDNSSSSPVDVAKLILPEKGEAVPQMPEIVMDLPTLHNSKDDTTPSRRTINNPRLPNNPSVPGSTLTLSDILLPPSAQKRNQVDPSSKSPI